MVENNEITFGSPVPNVLTSWAIRAEGTPNYQDVAHINNNRIFYRTASQNAYGGIFAQNTMNLHITGNTLTMADNIVNREGIFIAGGDDNLVSCNVVVGAGNNYDIHLHQSAITSEMSSDVEIGCNDVDRTTVGISILGPSASGSSLNIDIRSNTLNYHYFGLNYSLFALTNNQLLRGNIWKQNPVTFNGSTGWQAYHDALINLNTFTYFNTDNNTSPPPGGGTYHPSHQPNNWFKPNLIDPNLVCDNIPINFHYCDEFSNPLANGLSDLDLKIAEGEIENAPFTTETTWMMEKGLYDKLDDTPGLLADSTMNLFYVEKLGSAISSFKIIDDQKEILFASDSLLNTALLQNSIDRNQHLDALQIELNSLDSAIINNDSTTFNYLILGISQLLSVLENTSFYGDSMNVDKWIEKNLYTEPVVALNASVSTLVIPEVNEKLVNDIMLLTVAKQSSLFSPSQISILKFVANQCPVSGGLAVFRARALLSLSNPNQHFDDRAICEPFGGIRIGNTSNSILNNLKIYPNPAMNEVTLELNSEIYENAQFLMFNTSGQKVLEKRLLYSHKIFSFDISDIKPGVYQYQIVTKNQSFTNGKLVIIR